MNYIIANWKMNMSLLDINAWLKDFTHQINTNLNKDTKEIIIAPSFPYLGFVSSTLSGTGIHTAAQDVSENMKGAHTGDTGLFQVKDFCTYVIVGHSERKEPAEIVAKKADLCIQNDITPIICFINETDLEVYKKFQETALFAWEDPTNISKGGVYKPKDPEEIRAGLKNIRNLVKQDTVLIYGGSVNRENVGNLSEIEDLSGVLVGNASTDSGHFFDIITKYRPEN